MSSSGTCGGRPNGIAEGNGVEEISIGLSRAVEATKEVAGIEAMIEELCGAFMEPW